MLHTLEECQRKRQLNGYDTIKDNSLNTRFNIELKKSCGTHMTLYLLNVHPRSNQGGKESARFEDM